MKDNICLHVPVADLINGLDRISSAIIEYNFLFVKLDSADFFDFQDYDEDIFNDLRLDSDDERVYKIYPEGMWVKGQYVRDLVMSNNFAPRFNALYIFDKSIIRAPLPVYSDTSECVYFEAEENLPKDLTESIFKLNASGYMADGSGLNVFLTDQRLISVWNSTDWSEGNPEAQ